MTLAEKKLELFRRIDGLKESDLERLYSKFISLINTSAPYTLTVQENIAIDQALEAEQDEKYTPEQINNESKKKYPNLKFK